MTSQGQAVLSKALTLPPIERAGLIEELLASFDSKSRSTLDSAWAGEVEDRIDAHDRGELKASSLAKVVARINAK